MHSEAKIYDEMFSSGGYESVYDLPYHHQCYYPLFKAVLSELKKINKNSVLEVGCGTGSFGQIVRAKTDFEYRGFDFSDIAVKKAKHRSDKPSDYFVGNAVQHDTYVFADFFYDCIVCTEVLEHIEEDITVIKN